MDVARMEAQLREGGAEFQRSLFTLREIEYCSAKRYPARHFAARFAAKEAFFKAFGAGGHQGFPWREVEIGNDEQGKPFVTLYGSLEAKARERGVKALHVSLSHTRELAMAQLAVES